MSTEGNQRELHCFVKVLPKLPKHTMRSPDQEEYTFPITSILQGLSFFSFLISAGEKKI